MKKRCNVFTLWKSITLSVNERNSCCGDGVSLTLFAVMRCSLIFSAVLPCSEPPHVPLLKENFVCSGWLPRLFKDVRAQKVPTHGIFFKLTTQKGNDILLPKMQKKKWGSPTSFWREFEHAPKNTLNLKNRASFANKATVSVSPKILQLDLWNEMFSAKYCLSGPITWI